MSDITVEVFVAVSELLKNDGPERRKALLDTRFDLARERCEQQIERVLAAMQLAQQR